MNLNNPGRVPKRKESVKKVSEESVASASSDTCREMDKTILFRNGAKIEDFIRKWICLRELPLNSSSCKKHSLDWTWHHWVKQTLAKGLDNSLRFQIYLDICPGNMPVNSKGRVLNNQFLKKLSLSRINTVMHRGEEERNKELSMGGVCMLTGT